MRCILMSCMAIVVPRAGGPRQGEARKVKPRKGKARKGKGRQTKARQVKAKPNQEEQGLFIKRFADMFRPESAKHPYLSPTYPQVAVVP